MYYKLGYHSMVTSSKIKCEQFKIIQRLKTLKHPRKRGQLLIWSPDIIASVNLLMGRSQII